MGLSSTKLFSRIFAKKEKWILMVGLDAAMLLVRPLFLYKLKLGEIVTTIPTIATHSIARKIRIPAIDKDAAYTFSSYLQA